MAERLELSPDFTGQVAQPGEVCLHRVELAKGLLFAAAMLQDAGRFFDEPAAVFGARVQHAVKAPLAHNDVHLTAEARVTQQLLHVEEPAGVAVDCVLTRAVAKQGAADRDLGVFDGEGAVRVVDR